MKVLSSITGVLLGAASFFAVGALTPANAQYSNPLGDGYHQRTNPLSDGYIQDSNPLSDGYIQRSNPLSDGYVQDKGVFGY